MIILGLTGSIAMGKTTIAGFFAEAGIPVYDADKVSRELAAKDGQVISEIAHAFPDAVRQGIIDRTQLGTTVFGDARKKKTLENIIHPRIAALRKKWLEEQKRGGAQLVVLDIPLLYETGGEKNCDKVVLVTATPEIQKARACARPGMTEARFNAILKAQMSDAEKRKKADYIIDTSGSKAASRRRVNEIMDEVKYARNRS